MNAVSTAVSRWFYTRNFVKNTPWVLSFRYLKSPINKAYVAEQKTLYWVLIFATVFVFSGWFLAMKLRGSSVISLWLISLSFSMACVLLMIHFVTQFAQTNNYKEQVNSTPIGNVIDFSRSIDTSKLDNISVNIPTGIQLFQTEVKARGAFYIHGLVWQRFPASEKVTRPNIYFINREDSAPKYDKAYEYVEGNVRTIGWWFDVELEESFTSQFFPFTYSHIRIMMTPRNFSIPDMQLVPTLDAYDELYPEALPGLNKNIGLVKYDLIQSYFSYEHARLDFDFGLDTSNADQDRSILTYNIIVERHFAPIFMTYLLPESIVIIMLFCYFTFFS